MITIRAGRRCWPVTSSRDGAFVFGVTSTGVYCRPSCPSRRPRPDRVRFFSQPDEAERAGFRACLRCRPRDANSRMKIVESICQFLQQSTEEPVTLAALGERFGMNPFHLQRVFKSVAGCEPARVHGRHPHEVVQVAGSLRALSDRCHLRGRASVPAADSTSAAARNWA